MTIKLGNQLLVRVQEEMTHNISAIKNQLMEWLERPESGGIDVVSHKLREIGGSLSLMTQNEATNLTDALINSLNVLNQEVADGKLTPDQPRFIETGADIAAGLLFLDDYIGRLGHIRPEDIATMKMAEQSLNASLANQPHEVARTKPQVSRETYKALAGKINEMIESGRNQIDQHVRNPSKSFNTKGLIEQNINLANMFALLDLQAPQLLLKKINEMIRENLTEAQWIEIAEAMILVEESLTRQEGSEMSANLAEALSNQTLHSRGLEVHGVIINTSIMARTYFQQVRKDVVHLEKLTSEQGWADSSYFLSQYGAIYELSGLTRLGKGLTDLSLCYAELSLKTTDQLSVAYPAVIDSLVAMEHIFNDLAETATMTDQAVDFLVESVQSLRAVFQPSPQAQALFNDYAKRVAETVEEEAELFGGFEDALSDLDALDSNFKGVDDLEDEQEEEQQIINAQINITGINTVAGGQPSLNTVNAMSFTPEQLASMMAQQPNIAPVVANNSPAPQVETPSEALSEPDAFSLDDTFEEQAEKTPMTVQSVQVRPSETYPYFAQKQLVDLEALPVPENKSSFLETDDGAQVDEEIREFFMEEFNEIIENLKDIYPRWRKDVNAGTVTNDIRRAFHTLKGSGKTVGYTALGEFAWQHERLLNGVIEKLYPANILVQETIGDATDLLLILQQQESFVEPKGALLQQAVVAEEVRNALAKAPNASDADLKRLGDQLRLGGSGGDDANAEVPAPQESASVEPEFSLDDLTAGLADDIAELEAEPVSAPFEPTIEEIIPEAKPVKITLEALPERFLPESYQSILEALNVGSEVIRPNSEAWDTLSAVISSHWKEEDTLHSEEAREQVAKRLTQELSNPPDVEILKQLFAHASAQKQQFGYAEEMSVAEERHLAPHQLDNLAPSIQLDAHDEALLNSKLAEREAQMNASLAEREVQMREELMAQQGEIIKQQVAQQLAIERQNLMAEEDYNRMLATLKTLLSAGQMDKATMEVASATVARRWGQSEALQNDQSRQEISAQLAEALGEEGDILSQILDQAVGKGKPEIALPDGIDEGLFNRIATTVKRTLSMGADATTIAVVADTLRRQLEPVSEDKVNGLGEALFALFKHEGETIAQEALPEILAQLMPKADTDTLSALMDDLSSPEMSAPQISVPVETYSAPDGFETHTIESSEVIGELPSDAPIIDVPSAPALDFPGFDFPTNDLVGDTLSALSMEDETPESAPAEALDFMDSINQASEAVSDDNILPSFNLGSVPPVTSPVSAPVAPTKMAISRLDEELSALSSQSNAQATVGARNTVFLRAVDRFENLSKMAETHQGPEIIDDLLDAVYDIEDSIDPRNTPNWVWQVLDSIEQMLLNHKQSGEGINLNVASVLRQSASLIENYQESGAEEEAIEALNSMMNTRKNRQGQSPAPTVSPSSAISNTNYTDLVKDPNANTILSQTFLDEALMLFNRSQTRAETWDSNRNQLSHLDAIRRDMHTLKGSARMAGYLAIGDLSHAVESLIENIVNGYIPADKKSAAVLAGAMWQGSEMLDNIRDGFLPQPNPYILNNISACLNQPLPFPEVAQSANAQLASLATTSTNNEDDEPKLEDLELPSLSDIPLDTVAPSFELATSEALPETNNTLAFNEPVIEPQIEPVSEEANIAEATLSALGLDEDEPQEAQSEPEPIPAEQPQPMEEPKVEEALPEVKQPEPAPAETPKQPAFDESFDPVLVEIFTDEAQGLMATTAELLGHILDDKSAMEELKRTMHTLKGGARMVGLTQIGDTSHLMESVIERMDGMPAPKLQEAMTLLNMGQDALFTMLDSVLRSEMPAPATALNESLKLFAEKGEFKKPDLSAPAPAPVEEPKPELKPEPVSEPVQESASPTAEKVVEKTVEKVLETGMPNLEVKVEEPSFPTKDPEPEKEEKPKREINTALDESKKAPANNKKERDTSLTQFVRVDADLLDEMIAMLGESAIMRSRMENVTADSEFNLNELTRVATRITEQVRRLDNETEAQMLSRRDRLRVDNEHFDPLEMDRFSELQQLSRQLSEAIDDLKNIQDTLSHDNVVLRNLTLQQATVQRDLQDRLLATQLMRFDVHEPRLKRLIKQTAVTVGKEVNFVLEGGEVELERRLLEDLLPSLEHMIRNSIAHGIESPERRKELGKPEAGTIKVAVSIRAAEISVRIIDDGSGIDYDKIRAKAQAKGMLDPKLAHDENYLNSLMMKSGFSTAENVSQLSGRGVGMDVVHEMLKQRRGQIHAYSIRGKGTEFDVTMPFSMSIAEVLLVEVAGQTFAAPMSSITAVSQIDRDELLRSADGQTVFYRYQQTDYRVYILGNYFKPEQYEINAEEMRSPVLLLDTGGEAVAFHVDRILNRMEIIVKNVNRQVLNIPGISGATILGDGRVVPVLELLDLSRRLNELSLRRTDSSAVEEEKAKNILVVDDSVTMRKVSTRLLERNHYNVATAKDGLDAIDVIQTFIPDLIMLDIEMPRMDGFEFASHVRQHPNPEINQVPIIMITSRTGDKHRERADAIGVQGYLGKPYREDVLLETLEQLLNK